jgi:hypothetical protein
MSSNWWMPARIEQISPVAPLRNSASWTFLLVWALLPPPCQARCAGRRHRHRALVTNAICLLLLVRSSGTSAAKSSTSRLSSSWTSTLLCCSFRPARGEDLDLSCSPTATTPQGVQERGVGGQSSIEHRNLENPGREGESNWAGRRDGERSSLAKFSEWENWDGK